MGEFDRLASRTNEGGWTYGLFVDDWDDGSYGTDRPNATYFEDPVRFDQLRSASYTCNKIFSQKNVTVPKLSGLAFDASQNILYATSCETTRAAADEIPQGGVYVIELNNNYAVHQTWAIPFKTHHIVNNLESKEDTEAIAIAPDGTICVAFEQSQELATISGSVDTNDCTYDIFKQFFFTGKATGTDDGLEGFDFYANQFCFAVNEKNPTEVIMYNVESGTTIYKQTLSELSSDAAVTDIACLDNQDELWVLESKEGKIHRYKILTWKLDYIGFIVLPNTVKKNKPDALVLDTLHNLVYIGASGQGTANQTAKIFCLKVSEFVQNGKERDEFETTLMQPMSDFVLPATSISLPHRYESTRVLMATLPSALHTGKYCQPVLKIKETEDSTEKTYVMPSSRPIVGASVFFYADDLGYHNRVMENYSSTFVGVKVSGTTSNLEYITTSGQTLTDVIEMPYVKMCRVSYVTRGFEATSGDTFNIEISGVSVTNDDVFAVGTQVDITANAGTDRNAQLIIDGTNVEPASAYTVNLTDNVVIKAVYANNTPWDGSCVMTLTQSGATDGDDMTITTESGVTLENGDIVMSGTVVTVSATTAHHRGAQLFINEEEVSMTNNVYSFATSGHTLINMLFDDKQKYAIDYQVLRFNAESGDTVCVTCDGELLTPNTIASGFTDDVVSISASTVEGREVKVRVDGELANIVDNQYEYTIQSASTISVAFGAMYQLSAGINNYNAMANDVCYIKVNGVVVSAPVVLEAGTSVEIGGSTNSARILTITKNGNNVALENGKYTFQIDCDTNIQFTFDGVQQYTLTFDIPE